MLSCIWSIFLPNFRYNTKRNGKRVKEFPIIKDRIEKFLLVRFLLKLLFRQMVEELVVLLGHIKISQPILNILSWNSGY